VDAFGTTARKGRVGGISKVRERRCAMSEITMEDYARLATEIGLKRAAYGWYDYGRLVTAAELPAYLAEPAQFSRIVDWAVEHYIQVIITKHEGVIEVDFVPLSMSGTRRHVSLTDCKSVRAGVRDAAALATREGT
jgi:hypothetical protein